MAAGKKYISFFFFYTNSEQLWVSGSQFAELGALNHAVRVPDIITELFRWRSAADQMSQHHSGVVTSDRLAANKKLGDNIRHSFCWVHERREFRKLAAGYPELLAVCECFLKLIGNLFHWNFKRLLEDEGSQKQCQAEQKLQDTLNEILKSCESHLTDTNLHPELRRVFNGIKNDWEGLSLFFDLPTIPPDNNPAERALRGPVVGRKNYYGCGSKWSAAFTAAMFTLDATLKLNNVNTEQFLVDYLTACANNGGKAPPNATTFLPWNQRPPPD